MIITVTLNPAVDRTLWVGSLSVGDTNRVQRSVMDPGGKGVNMSLVLRECGAETTATGFIAGKMGQFIKTYLEAHGVPTAFIEVTGETRLNIAIETLSGGPPTTLHEPGPEVSMEDLRKLGEGLRQYLPQAKFVAFGGSLPPGVPNNVYATLIKYCQEQGVRAFLDADGPPLLTGLESKPFLIKPNRAEAERLLGRSLRTLEDAAAGVAELAQRGIAMPVISMGLKGAVTVSGREVWHAIPPTVTSKSTVGSGDSMLAGIAAALARGASPADALRLGTAAGAATAASPDANLATKAEIEAIYPQVRLRKLA